jgi:hypothetical protein
MFHPVGPQSPSVYWRRRLVLLATFVIVVMLIALTARAAMGAGGGTPGAAGPTGVSHHPSAPASTSASKHGPHNRTSTRSSHRLTSQSSSQSSAGGSSSSNTSRHHRHHPGTPTSSTSAPPPPCQARDLAVQAVVGQNGYHVGDKPVVMLQVTNTGATPCVQDLADKQIVLKIYNGESRVWGSHDCQVQSGTDDRVLPVDQAVRVSITWSGYTSQPGCTDRQRVGAGSYTLYAWLAGHEGKAASFAIS